MNYTIKTIDVIDDEAVAQILNPAGKIVWQSLPCAEIKADPVHGIEAHTAHALARQAAQAKLDQIESELFA